MNNSYTAIVKQAGDWWIGWVEEVPGVNAQEKTKEELLVSLKEILREAIEFNRSEARQAAESNYAEEPYRGMKRRELMRHLHQHGCSLVREGGNHSWWANPAKNKRSAVLRHAEINEILARKICKDWTFQNHDGAEAGQVVLRFARKRACRHSPCVVYFRVMSTLTEIEEAVATLPEQEQKKLFHYLENRLASKQPRKRMLPLVPSIGQPITQREIDDAIEAE